MKKIVIITTIFLIGILSACTNNQNVEVEQISLDTVLQYNFKTATFNNSSPDDVIYGIHDYKEEFYKMHLIALSRGYISNELTREKVDAYEAFFEKLESLNRHNEEFFTMSSESFQALFEDGEIEMTANDMFAFENLKELFQSLEDRIIPLETIDLIDIISGNSITSEEYNALKYLYTIYNELKVDYSTILDIDDSIETIIILIESTTNKELNQTQIDDLTVACNQLKELK